MRERKRVAGLSTCEEILSSVFSSATAGATSTGFSVFHLGYAADVVGVSPIAVLLLRKKKSFMTEGSLAEWEQSGALERRRRA
jgi:hypothetical protein